LDCHPPIWTIKNVCSAELHPWASEATSLLVSHSARGQNLDEGCRPLTAIQDNVGDHPFGETHFRGRMRDVVRNVLYDAAVAAVAGARPRHARTWAGPSLPFLDDSEQLGFGGTVNCALARTTLAAAVSKVRATHLAATKDHVRPAARAAVRLTWHGTFGPDQRAVLGDGHRNRDRRVRHGMKRYSGRIRVAV
jgi:hypothetical protein